ncbi:MAG: putative Mn2+ efflux pump MntP [Candidatus Methanohalarchaeum thermophilum]|uniref:Putative manganese efflux pump MntP n=1 Tax=Methanohalarchaeum thermophilum TaxID=1903181 RepID=A0A1Q6DSV8_METT1|nr:MAG: putative Mn2+ efflux pump MntP [Candidatus Methanohalarchaeum thermophilum]
MDCFAVSIANGIICHKNKVINSLKIASAFGFFHFGLPLVGWYLGTGVQEFIETGSKWIAAIILTAIGIKMIQESYKECDKNLIDVSGIGALFLFSIATSIDSLAIGTTLPLLTKTIIGPATTIGITAFIMSLTGFHLGNTFGNLFEDKSEAIGGIILILIAIKTII